MSIIKQLVVPYATREELIELLEGTEKLRLDTDRELQRLKLLVREVLECGPELGESYASRLRELVY